METTNKSTTAVDFSPVATDLLKVVEHRRVAIEASGYEAQAARVAHAANVEYAKHLCAWAHSVEPTVMFFDLTMDELRKASVVLFNEAKLFRDGYVSSNISVIWKRIRENARKYAEANSLYGLSPNMLGGEGEGSAGADEAPVTERSATQVIESAEKNGGVWLYRNLERRDSLTLSEVEFKNGLFDLLVSFGLTESAIKG